MQSAARVWTRRAKLRVHQTRRLLAWALHPRAFDKPELAEGEGPHPHIVYAKSVPIARVDPDAHVLLEAGKRTNVALAAPHFDGVFVSAERPLSFWRALGRISASRGYQDGMELRGGCIVPALGGGICILSNALFEMAARLGWSILERHGHSMEAVPSESDLPWGMDATVLWPHVDLRIAPRHGSARLGMRVADGKLHLTVHATSSYVAEVELSAADDCIAKTAAGRVRTNRVIRKVDGTSEVLCTNEKRLLHSPERRRNCYTCEEHSCRERPIALRGRT